MISLFAGRNDLINTGRFVLGSRCLLVLILARLISYTDSRAESGSGTRDVHYDLTITSSSFRRSDGPNVPTSSERSSIWSSKFSPPRKNQNLQSFFAVPPLAEFPRSSTIEIEIPAYPHPVVQRRCTKLVEVIVVAHTKGILRIARGW